MIHIAQRLQTLPGLGIAEGRPADQPMGLRCAVCAPQRDAVQRITAAGKPAGFLSTDQGYVREIVAAGARFVAVGVDAALMRRGAVALLSEWR